MQDIKQARDEILTHLMDKLNGESAIDGMSVLFWGLDEDPPKGVDEDGNPVAWIRVILSHNDGGQDSLAGDSGKVRVRHAGVLTVEIYEPRGAGGERLDDASWAALKALTGESTPNGAWFRNARRVDYGEDGLWFRVDVLANFEYDTFVS